jgi:hypothetical protein
MRKTEEHVSELLKKTIHSPFSKKRLFIYTLTGALLLQPLAVTALKAEAAVSAAAVTTPQLKLLQENMITSGAKRLDYLWTGTRNGSKVAANVHVVAIDLTNPYVSLNTMSGNNNKLNTRSSVAAMVKNTEAVAGINADYFDTSSGTDGVPFNAQITSGQLVTSPMRLNGMYAFAVTSDRKPVIDRYEFKGSIQAEDGTAFELAGMNKSSYSAEYGTPGYSHVDAMYIYTSVWTNPERPNKAISFTTPTEVLVQDGRVTQVAINDTLPLKPPANGYILRTHGKAAQYVRDHLTVGSKVSASYNLTSLTSGKAFDPSTFQMMVGGHTILVSDGKAAAYSRSISNISGSSAVARTGIGYSKDNKTIYLVTVEDYGDSSGMNIGEFQKTLIGLGVWKGINLDGGGSTTMVDRPLGEFATELTHSTTTGTQQRLVANGVGVYTSAPQGTVKGITASGKGILFIGEQASYSLKAYDTYYNPIDPAGVKPQWSVGNAAVAKLQSGTLTALKPGKTTLTVKSGAGSDSLPVEILGSSQIAQMTIAAGSQSLQPGSVISVPVKVKLLNGQQYTVPAASVKWELKGFSGRVQGDKITVAAVDQGAKAGYAIARYDGFSSMITLSAGSAERDWENFESTGYGITFTGSKATVQGSAQVVTGLPQRESSKALQLTYDFTQDTGIKAAYAQLDANGRAVEGSPQGMAVDVYGDGGFNMLRAQVVDAAGKTHMVEFAKMIDWTGWKRVSADFGPYKMTYPVKIKSLYVATAAEGQDERAATGQIAFDDIAFQYPSAIGLSSDTKVVLTLNKKSAAVNGKSTQLDAAPIALKGTTYLPLRFVADAMNGQVGWNAAAKRATVLRGDKLMEMQVGVLDFVLNGVRSKAEVAPIIQNGRTLVPLRLVSEQLGLSVNWEPKTKTITIQ